ncbi:MAG: DUF2520 domain-containing protein [Xanthomonadales bacterium]|nr:DUF2520 domain-containing protein [Xanthomonadales bacterium]
MTAEPYAMNVIGCGRAAGSLARLWLEADAVSLRDVLNRSSDSTRHAVRELGAGEAATRLSAMRPAVYWLIGTGDDQVAEAARTLAAARSDLQGALAFHLAGRLGLDVLEPLAKAGAGVAALHPVRSLTHDRLDLARFRGTACVAEGSPEALARLQPLVMAIGGLWLPVSGIDRGLYHAALSIVSNVTKGVAWKAQKWLEHAGLPADTAAAVTHQLLQSTVEDLSRAGARQSITGPVVRGDTRTVEAHLAAVAASHPRDVELYRILARTVLELAQERGDLDAAVLARFQALLGD